MIEIFEIIASQLTQNAQVGLNLKEVSQQALDRAIVNYLQSGKTALQQLDSDYIWFVSGGGTVKNFPPSSRLQLNSIQDVIEVTGDSAHLVGIHPSDLLFLQPSKIQVSTRQITETEIEIPYALEEEIAELETLPPKGEYKNKKYPFVRGKGQLIGASACFEMVSKHLSMPFRKEVVCRIFTEQIKRQETISLQLCAYLSELVGLKAQLVDILTSSVARIPVPALIRYEDNYAVLYETSDRIIVLGVPEKGIVRCKPAELIAKLDVEESSYPPQIRVLLLNPTKETPKERFGLQWFAPYLTRYRRVLIEVFIASFFVQLAALANPLVIQLIIDKVIAKNSINTLHILGVLLLVVGIFEAILTTLRTYLFVDTTNRIDMGLGSEIIDHLLRLPLRYFEKRPVGELFTRINELENIRQFLTGTALTVGLDAIFSLVYVVVMLIYSWQLTLVGLGTIPVFIVLTLIASPTVSKQLRTKAERNAETQSYLVEVMSGIQTVKAQNIELRSRFSWQERYSHYVAAGFKTVITSTLANSTSNFLNKLSALLVLWVGAYLVLQGDLTLGELIAFRIISGYVTSPILRLA